MNVFKIIKLLIINHSNIKTEVSMKEKSTLCTLPDMHIYIYIYIYIYIQNPCGN